MSMRAWGHLAGFPETLTPSPRAHAPAGLWVASLSASHARRGADGKRPGALLPSGGAALAVDDLILWYFISKEPTPAGGGETGTFPPY